MDWTRLIQELSLPEAFPHQPPDVEVRQTHISVVYLTQDFAYKVKKPVNLGFLDFSTLQRRKHFCDEEVRLNSRLAPGVYLGVVPVVITPQGPRFEGEGEPVEWAVKMKRLPDDATLLSHLRAGRLDLEVFALLARRIASFHREQGSNPRVSTLGSFESVSRHVFDNLEAARRQIGVTITDALFSKLFSATGHELLKHQALIEARAKSGRTRDTHGDLHLDHVYFFPQKAPPDDLVILDCVEFGEEYRCSDVVSDMAFLCMDLVFNGKSEWMRVFADEYFAASGDVEGKALLPFYTAYRAAVRAKVEGMKAGEGEIRPGDREAAKASSRSHWLLSYGQVASPRARPLLVLSGGAPGSGKSRLAKDLAGLAGLTYIGTDYVRKELAGLMPTDSAKADFGAGIYTPEWTARTYGECLARARGILLEGGRVVIDATFRDNAARVMFYELARELCVPFVFFRREVDETHLRERLSRRNGEKPNVSDADWGVAKAIIDAWEPCTPEIEALTVEIGHFDERTLPAKIALKALEGLGVA